MNFFHATLLGAVEGITEFLPISSTFHLILTTRFLSLPQDDFAKLFEVVIQSGAVISVLLLYFNLLLSNRRLLTNLAVSFLPTAVVGLSFHRIIKSVFFESFNLMLAASFLVGLIILYVEFLIKKGRLKNQHTLSHLSLSQAFFVGLCQSLAVIPGVSRSGATIISLLFLGVARPHAAIYSFLLAVPTIFTASVLDLIKSPPGVLSPDHLILLTVGFISAFIFARLSVKWLITFLQQHSLVPFAIYRLLLSPLLFFWK